MTPSPHSGARPCAVPPARLLVVLTLLLAVTFALVLGGVPTARPAAADTAESEEAVVLEVTSLGPEALGPGDTLSVSARVTNGTAGTLESPSVALGIDGRALSTRSALESWATTPLDGRVGVRVATEDLGQPLAPGASTEVTFTVPVAELNLNASSDWGPRGLSVTVSDGGSRQAVQRTFVLWAPSGEVTPVRLSVVAALTGPAVDPDPVAYDDALSAAVGADGRLGRVLAATGGTTDVGWVADPALLAAAAGAADPAVNAWAEEVATVSAGRSTFALHAYDPDVAAFAHAGLALPAGTPLPSGPGTSDEAVTGGSTSGGAPSGSTAPEDTDGQDAAGVQGTADDQDSAGSGAGTVDETSASALTAGWRTDLAWPADAVPDLSTTTLAAASGATATIVGPGGLVPDGSLTYTPSGVAQVTTTAGPVTALVADPVLTALLSAGDGSGVTATQRLLAETAVIARERPAEQRHVLVALPRTWGPDPARFTARLDALRAAAWVDLAPVEDLLAVAPPAVDRTPLPDDAPGAGEISATQLRSLDRSRTDLAAFATVAADPATITRPLEPAFVTPTAVAFRASEPSRVLAVQAAEQRSANVRGSLSVETRAPFLFIAEEEDLPVRVRSTLEQDATVQVVLRPDDPRLRAPERRTVTIPAATRDADGDLVPTETSVAVPVEGFGSGNVTVEVELVSAAQPQVRVAEPEEFVVRVRADWESVGTVVVAVLLGIALLAGIWRTVRRGRSPRRVAGATLDQPAPQGPGPDGSATADASRSRDEERVE
ncbi:DUF6049 family protein [Cellulosimicrobium protaetiae]|uniref:Uncharacterized protein n=1 Tax=Cellulosimicrobium protaetiae TaxID=2587808 RepID=A0A6M5UCZ1_9MICO|nr:DUF6049 family protein [Cellulosimicrobium protaetiae]QJW35201.1 hypothetical protein FIC82_002255 [Cellulosimicrobium protaetiae]